LLFWESWQLVYVAVRPFFCGVCLGLLDYCIHNSPTMLPALRDYGTFWKAFVLDLWFGFLYGLAAVMLAKWLYAPEKQR